MSYSVDEDEVRTDERRRILAALREPCGEDFGSVPSPPRLRRSCVCPKGHIGGHYEPDHLSERDDASRVPIPWDRIAEVFGE